MLVYCFFRCRGTLALDLRGRSSFALVADMEMTTCLLDSVSRNVIWSLWGKGGRLILV
ncbi:hypothetical protein EXN66_Car003437 [Channa argus]|uniref:Uncharacterized protein n=1 Tax=Channa argus TaxID=215402 RepID=A0A6G1PBY2_CHAAH|nr:hypothetical protein EXN66_Car003437 [Channa argus]